MRFNRSKNYKNKIISLRVNDEDFNRLCQKALLYTNGNLSEYILYCSLNYFPEKKDFEKTEGR